MLQRSVWRGGVAARRCVTTLRRLCAAARQPPCGATLLTYCCCSRRGASLASSAAAAAAAAALSRPAASTASSSVTSCETRTGSPAHEERITQADVRALHAELQSVHDEFGSLLEDRRTNYRADVIAARLPAARAAIAEKLRQRLPSYSARDTTALTRDTLRALKTTWLPLLLQDGAGSGAKADVDARYALYTLVLSSTLVRSDADVRLVWQEMTEHDRLTPRAAIYRAVLLALPSLYLTAVPAAPSNNNRNESSEANGAREWRLHRRELGEAASYYMGHAIASQGQHCGNDDAVLVTHAVWDAFLVNATLAQMAPKLVDLWWDSLLRSCAARGGGGEAAALPFVSVHALLAWAAAQRDVERAMRFFHAANQRGVCLPGLSHCVTAPGALTARHDITSSNDDDNKANAALQQCQVRLFAKLLCTAKSLRADGGLRAMVVRDIKRLIDPRVVQCLPWGVVNDILSGLSMPSAMQLLRFCAAARVGGEAEVPFLLWAALLRRCARDHLLEEAEALFRFIGARFACSPREKAELVEIMLRMYATLPTPDYASAMSLFLEHGLGAGLQAQAMFYELLVRAADSRNTAMMTFLEGCAAGVRLSAESFEALMGANPFATVSALSRKLPHDYSPSKLDAQLRIPANVDAHLRREEALRARGKPLFDSTGDAVG